MDQIKWCDPPPKTRGESKESKWEKLLRPLTERPNTWAMISTKQSESQASALAYYLRSVMGEGWEFLSRGLRVWAISRKERTTTENTTQGVEAGEREKVERAV